VVVRWKKSDQWEAWSSVAAFSSFHAAYPARFIYNRMRHGKFDHYRFELRRVEWRHSPVRLRIKGMARRKPGPKGPRAKRP
jgi:hypothetical protein